MTKCKLYGILFYCLGILICFAPEQNFYTKVIALSYFITGFIFFFGKLNE